MYKVPKFLSTNPFSDTFIVSDFFILPIICKIWIQNITLNLRKYYVSKIHKQFFVFSIRSKYRVIGVGLTDSHLKLFSHILPEICVAGDVSH